MENDRSSFYEAMLAMLDGSESATNALFVLAQEDELPDVLSSKIASLLEDKNLSANAFHALSNKKMLPQPVIALLFEKLMSQNPITQNLACEFFLHYEGLVFAAEESKPKLIEVIKKTTDSSLRRNLLAILVSALPTHPGALPLIKFLLGSSSDPEEKKFIARTISGLFAEQNLIDDGLIEILAKILRTQNESVSLRAEVAKCLSILKVSDKKLQSDTEKYIEYTESIEYIRAELEESLPLSRQEEDFTQIMRDEEQSPFLRKVAAQNIVSTEGMNSDLVSEAKAFLKNLPPEDS